MASLNLDIPHQLTKAEAISRVKNLLANLKRDHGDQVKDVRENWQGDKADFGFSIKGFDLSGLIQVNNNSVSIDSDLPFALSFFKGKIASIITDKANEVLGK